MYTAFGFRSETTPASAHYLLKPMEQLCGMRLEHGVRVLDVGCGPGFYAGWFASYGCTVVGIDSSETGVDLARRTYPRVRFEVATPDGALLDRIGEEPFDLVICSAGLNAQPDPLRFARACLRALRPGGRFVCTTPFPGHLRELAHHVSSVRERGAQPADLPAVEGPRGWTRRGITRLLAQAGFENVQFRGAGRVPLLWSLTLVSADRPLDTISVERGDARLTA